MNNREIKKAIVVGIIPAMLELILVYSFEPNVSPWILLQSSLFWFTCGFLVYLVSFKNKIVISSILFTVFLNLPWYIALTVVQNKVQNFLPLFIASLVFGLIIGIISKKLYKK